MNSFERNEVIDIDIILNNHKQIREKRNDLRRLSCNTNEIIFLKVMKLFNIFTECVGIPCLSKIRKVLSVSKRTTSELILVAIESRDVLDLEHFVKTVFVIEKESTS